MCQDPNAGYWAGRDNESKRLKKARSLRNAAHSVSWGTNSALNAPHAPWQCTALGKIPLGSEWRRGKVLESASDLLSPLSQSFYQCESGLPLMLPERIFFHLHLSWAGESYPLPLRSGVWCPGFGSTSSGITFPLG